ncbi:redox-regulated ATPase YchF, partial [Candidatus Peregrinibacteria bacterium CG10_big_fil_rev_8_21_14_0_10_49_16]
LALADLATLQNKLQKLEGAARTGDKEKQKELEVANKIVTMINADTDLTSTVETLYHSVPSEQETPSYGVSTTKGTLDADEWNIARPWNLLSLKPILYTANCSEKQLTELSEHQTRANLGVPEGTPIIPFCAKLEEELNDLPESEARQLLQELHLTSSGLDRLITAAYTLLGYITFFTAGPKEVRAWTVEAGTTAPQAAGVIHTDFEKGFIRAETISFDDYIAFGGEQGAKEKGRLRTEGKDYIVQDGDIMHFRFNN